MSVPERVGTDKVGESVPVEHLSLALDEIFALRRALAYEAAVTEAHLDLKSFPKSRRKVADEQVVRMRQAACGAGHFAYSSISGRGLHIAMKRAGARDTLTRTEFEAQHHIGGQVSDG